MQIKYIINSYLSKTERHKDYFKAKNYENVYNQLFGKVMLTVPIFVIYY
jgi:hypothetical protein